MEKKKIHLTAVCGMGMGSLAGLLVAQGHEVRGSDENVYPPMSTQLEKLGVPLMTGYRAENLDWGPDLVITGNAVSKGNPECERVEAEGLERLSFPEALSRFFIEGHHSIVVAGTHGKTTTTALAAWVLHHAGRDPGFMAGGVLGNFGATCRLGGGGEFVSEGDEYDSAWFDKGPKFLHYQPRTAILTSIEFDHADIYPDLDAVREAFGKFVRLIPEDGLLVACADYPDVREAVKECRGRVATYGVRFPCQWTGVILGVRDGFMEYEVDADGMPKGPYRSPLVGSHNLLNILAVMAALKPLGIDVDQAARAVEEFQGIRRRQEVRGEARGVTVVDDFAHHPTAAAETIRAMRMKYPGRRLWCVFEPRTNTTRTNVFQKEYAEAFAAADEGDEIVIAAVDHPEKVADPERRFSPERLVADLVEKGRRARYLPQVGEIVKAIAAEAREGDVALVMSNGGFGGLHAKLLEALAG